MRLSVVNCHVHGQRGQHGFVVEKALARLHDTCFQIVFADGVKRALILTLVEAVVVPVFFAVLRRP